MSESKDFQDPYLTTPLDWRTGLTGEWIKRFSRPLSYNSFRLADRANRWVNLGRKIDQRNTHAVIESVYPWKLKFVQNIAFSMMSLQKFLLSFSMNIQKVWPIKTCDFISTASLPVYLLLFFLLQRYLILWARPDL